MGKSGERFIQHRDEEAQREVQELAAMEAAFLSTRPAINWHQYFTYDEATGNLIWRRRPVDHFKDEAISRRWNTRYAGKAAGCVDETTGYIQVSVCGKRHLAHRIIIEMHGGPLFPKQQVDHINGMRSNNRRSNLRRCSNSQNMMNNGKHQDNTSGFKGASYHKRSGRWMAQIMVDGSYRYLGLFDTPEGAHVAYCAAAQELHGQFHRTV